MTFPRLTEGMGLKQGKILLTKLHKKFNKIQSNTRRASRRKLPGIGGMRISHDGQGKERGKKRKKICRKGCTKNSIN